MVQPEPYEVIHTVEEPIVTHHVSYKEALPASETIAYASTGLGTQVVDGWQEVLPVEAAHWNDPRIAVDGPRPQTWSQPVVDVPVATVGAPVVETFVGAPVVGAPVVGAPVVETVVGAPAWGTPVIAEPVVWGRR